MDIRTQISNLKKLLVQIQSQNKAGNKNLINVILNVIKKIQNLEQKVVKSRNQPPASETAREFALELTKGEPSEDEQKQSLYSLVDVLNVAFSNENGRKGYAEDLKEAANLCRLTYGQEAIWRGLTQIRRGPQKRTHLMFASKTGDLDRVKFLTEIGRQEDIDILDSNNFSALNWAIDYGQIDVAIFLLSKNASTEFVKRDENGEETTQSLMMFACGEGHLEGASLLLDNGYSLDEKATTDNLLLLSLNSISIASFLIACGVEVTASALEKSSYLEIGADFLRLFLPFSDVNHENERGRSLLHLASRFKKIEAVQVLIDNEVNINSVSPEGWTPLHSVCHNRFSGKQDEAPRIVKLLIESNPSADFVNARDDFGQSALMAAIDTDNSGTFLSLLKICKKLKINVDLDIQDHNRRCALIYAMGKENEDTFVPNLLKFGADPNGGNDLDDNAPINNALGPFNPIYPLLYAVEKNDFEATEAISNDKRTKLDVTLNDNKNAIFVGCELRSYESLMHLRFLPEMINQPDDDGVLPIHIASIFRAKDLQPIDPRIFQFLLDNGANPNAKLEGKTPLHLILTDGAFGQEETNKEAIRILLHHGANLEELDDDGLTPFLAACEVGNPEIIEFLASLGANVKAVDNQGNNGLHLMLIANREIWEFHVSATELIRVFPDVINGKNIDGYTPLAFVNNKNEEKYLLRKGASAKTFYGAT